MSKLNKSDQDHNESFYLKRIAILLASFFTSGLAGTMLVYFFMPSFSCGGGPEWCVPQGIEWVLYGFLLFVFVFLSLRSIASIYISRKNWSKGILEGLIELAGLIIVAVALFFVLEV